MKPFIILALVVSNSLVTGQEQQAVEARVKSVLGTDYAALLKMTSSEKEVFDDMVIELLEHQMTVPEFMDVLHHTSPSVYKTLRPLTLAYLDVDPHDVEEGTRVFVAKIIEKLSELKKTKMHELLTAKGNAKNQKMEKKGSKKVEISKTQKKEEDKPSHLLGDNKKIKQSASPMDLFGNVARYLKLAKEEKEVVGEMIMELAEGQMTAEEFLDVLSHTSPSTHAALIRVVNSLRLNSLVKIMKLHKHDKEVVDAVEDMLHELVNGQMTVEEFLSVLEHTAPSAHRLLKPLVKDILARAAGLKEKAAKEFVEKVTHALREIGKALFAHQDGQLTKAQKDKEVMAQLINVVKDYGALGRSSEAASEELNETFPDLLAIGQAASINKSQVSGYL